MQLHETLQTYSTSCLESREHDILLSSMCHSLKPQSVQRVPSVSSVQSVPIAASDIDGVNAAHSCSMSHEHMHLHMRTSSHEDKGFAISQDLTCVGNNVSCDVHLE